MVQTNGYLVETAEGNFLVDAPSGIGKWAAGMGVRIDSVYLTHQHYDHVEDVAELQEAGAKVFAWADYSKELTLESFGASWGLPEVAPYTVDHLIPVGDLEMPGGGGWVAHIPGHSSDSIAFIFREAGVVFAGDALFAGSVGRCDLPGGDFELLISGICREILPLSDAMEVRSGHGSATTVGKEKTTNPYLK